MLVSQQKVFKSKLQCSIVRLRNIVPQALETVITEMIHKFFKTCRDYEKAYRDGRTCKNVEAAVKVYKSHRRVFSVDK